MWTRGEQGPVPTARAYFWLLYEAIHTDHPGCLDYQDDNGDFRFTFVPGEDEREAVIVLERLQNDALGGVAWERIGGFYETRVFMGAKVFVLGALTRWMRRRVGKSTSI